MNKEQYEKFNEQMFIKYEKGDRLLKANFLLKFIQNQRFDKAIKLANIKNNYKILDTGFGMGELFKRIHKGELYGIDISETAMEEAKKKLANKTVHLQKAFIENTPFPDNYFDIVFCMEILEHVLDPLVAILELKRVLKKQGVLIVTTPSPLLEKLKEPIFKLRLNKIILKGVSKNPEAHLRTFTKTSLVKLLKNNGFRINKVFYSPFIIAGETIVLKATKL